MRGDGFFVPIAVVFFAAAALLMPLGRGASEGPSQTMSQPAADATGDRPPNVETAETLLAQFFGEPPAPARTSQASIEQLRAAAATHRFEVDTLIATVPDPIDSNSRWQFDPVQDAIQRAAGANSLVLDRFFIPDWKAWVAEKDRGKERGRLHESWPGVVLFRGRRKLLVTFLVFETPTQGIHLEAFRQAALFASRWRNGQPGVLKILGPTFSGTSPSLRIGLANAARSGLLKGASVRVVSGSATSPSNESVIEGRTAEGNPVADGVDVPVTFAATVLSSRDLLFGIIQHLQEHRQLGEGRFALLTEQNTSYGQGARARHEDHKAGARPAGESPEQHVLASALQLQFPLHVSRLRAGADRIVASANASRGVVPQTAPMQSLSLKDEGLITDQVPMFGDSTTPAYVELVLVNILNTVRREGITTVALVATDARDKLFLSQMLARYCPDVRVFLLEADLLYTHPDYSGYMRGALIASTYPLFNANQTWSATASGNRRSQFATSNTQGVFNAYEVLMSPDGRGNLAKMLEYRTPFGDRCAAQGCAPPLWISVSGMGGMWPIDAVPVNSRYIHHVQPPPPPDRAKATPSPDHAQPAASFDESARDHRQMLPVPTWAVVALLALNLCAWMQSVGYFVGSRDRQHRLWPLLRRLFGHDSGARRYLFTSFTALFLLLAFTDLLGCAWVWFVFEHERQIWLTAAVLVTGATLIGLLAAMVDIARRRRPTLMQEITDGTKLAFCRWTFAYRALFIGLLVVTARYLLLALNESAFPGEPESGVDLGDSREAAARRALLLLLNRSVTLTNGVSPAVPVLLLCGALYLWGLQHFRPRGVLSRSMFRNRVAELEALNTAATSAPTRKTAVSATSRAAVDPLTRLRTVVFALAIAIQLFFYWGIDGGVTTIDTPGYTRFFICASVLVQGLIAVALVQFLFMWTTARRALEHLAGAAGVDSPLSKAFKRLPAAIKKIGMLSRVPTVRELETAVARAGALQPALVVDGVPGEVAAILSRQPEFPIVNNDLKSEELEQALADDLKADPGQPFSASKTWRTLIRVGTAARESAAAMQASAIAASADAIRPWLERADDLTALEIVLLVRDVSARMVASMILTLVLTLLVLASHTWYPAQPRQMLMGFSWACILATAAASASVFIQMDRNEIMCRINGTEGNKLTWDLAFVSKLLVWVVIPLLSLFAAQFPEAGSAILQWLQPVQKALP